MEQVRGEALVNQITGQTGGPEAAAGVPCTANPEIPGNPETPETPESSPLGHMSPGCFV